MELMDLKKLFLIVILALTTVSCELFSPSRSAEYEKDRARRCYRNSYGNIFCKDADGNNY